MRQLALVESYIDPVTARIKVRDSFRVTPSFGAVFYRSLDLGFPDVRSAVQDNPQSDGTYDETRYMGARSVALTGVVAPSYRHRGIDPGAQGWDPNIGWDSPSWFCSYLGGWAAPGRRSHLYLTEDSGRARFLDVRGESFTAPVDGRSDERREFQMQFVNPSGKIYSFDTGPSGTADGRTRVVIRQTAAQVTGRTYPETAPYTRNYPALQAGSDAALYLGAVPNGFVANVYSGGGTMTGPRITVTGPDNVSQSIGLSGFTIPAGRIVTFDTINRTVIMRPLGSSATNALDQYLAAPLQWPVLKPGVNRLGSTPQKRVSGYNQFDFAATTAAADAYVEVLFNSADLI